MEERLQKILSRAGVASRRAAEVAIVDGRVTVNGETVRALGTKADAGRDDIRVDGVRVQAPAASVYLLLNKPKGVVSTRQDPQGRPTVMELVPAVPGLFPVGRLDVTTEGLLILTNDGAFADRVAHPRYEVPRVYQAKVHRVPDEETLARLRRGVLVEGERLTVDRVRVLEAGNNAWLEVTLHEGKHHEVRRLLEAVGHPVSKLRRVGLGPLTARGLKPGQFRALTPAEVRAFTTPAGSRARTAWARPPASRERIARPHAPRGRSVRPHAPRGRSARPHAPRAGSARMPPEGSAPPRPPREESARPHGRDRRPPRGRA